MTETPSPDLLAVLAEPNRRRLLELLREGERTVTELAAQFPVTRPAISQHLGVLAAAGLVEVRRDGRFRRYRLDPAGMAAVRRTPRRLLDQRARGARPYDRSGPRPARAIDRTIRDSDHPRRTPMTIEKSILVPLGADETFALLTEPERLRRWMAVAARVDLRAGGGYRWTAVPGANAGGHLRRGGARPAARVHLRLGG